MRTITKEFTKEQLQQIIETDHVQCGEASALARIALASLEAEVAGFIVRHKGTGNFGSWLHSKADWFKSDEYEVLRAYTAPPAPVSVPDEDLLHMAASAIDDLLSNKDRSGAGVWADIPAKLRRAAMLQGADRPQNEPQNIPENIPATQFKPVADLYGLTSPTGGETSFTFDAVEARNFIDGGWSCQEYVELERFHEAITNHTEDKLAMVDHSGDSNNMVEPVTTTYKLPFEQWLSKQTGTIDVEYGCVMTEVFFHWLRVAYDAGNSPVIPDGSASMLRRWLAFGRGMQNAGCQLPHNLIAESEAMLAAAPHDTHALNSVQSVDSVADRWIPVSERMPDVGVKVLCFPVKDEPIHATFNGQLWLQDVSWSGSEEPIDNVIPVTVTHWMPLPAAPQQEVK